LEKKQTLSSHTQGCMNESFGSSLYGATAEPAAPHVKRCFAGLSAR